MKKVEQTATFGGGSTITMEPMTTEDLRQELDRLFLETIKLDVFKGIHHQLIKIKYPEDLPEIIQGGRPSVEDEMCLSSFDRRWYKDKLERMTEIKEQINKIKK